MDENSLAIRGCRFCGVGFDPVHGCAHTVVGYVAPAVPVLVGPGGVLLVDQAKPVVVRVSPTTGLPIMDRW
jgi:hypothetical protein